MAAAAALGLVVACSDQTTSAPGDTTNPGDPGVPQLNPAAQDAYNTTGTNNLVEIRGAYWLSGVASKVGTGNIHPFLDLHASPNEEGFNTDGAFSYTQARTSWTNPVPLNVVPPITGTDIPTGVPAGTYREFVLDLNESNSTPDALISLDFWVMWLCKDNATYNPANGGSWSGGVPLYTTYAQVHGNADCHEIYTIHDGAPNATDHHDNDADWIQADDSKSKGSGNDFDYQILIPNSAFDVETALADCPYNNNPLASCGWFIVLESKMGGKGGDWISQGGFEEYSTVQRPAPPQIRLVKHIVNDNGGTAVIADFGITLDDGSVTFGAGNTVGSTTTYSTGYIPTTVGAHSLKELNVTGYTEGTWSCSPVAASASGYNTGSVTLAEGQFVTCEITNNDDPAQIKLVKKIINDNGGTAVVGAFDIELDAVNATFGAGSTVGSTTTYETAFINVNAGAHTFTEIDVTGYAEGTWSCTPVAASGSAYNAGAVTLTSGQSTTCTIENNDEAASIKLVKKIINDNGGTAVVGAFDIELDAVNATFGAGSTVGSTTTYETEFISVSAGAHTFTEIDVTGYTEGTWSCTPVAATGSAYGAGSVTLTNGQSTTCTIENNDDPAELILIKRVTNDHGGTKTAADFPFTDNLPGSLGSAAVSGSAPTLTYTYPAVTGLSAGTKTFSEGNIAGYTEGSWECKVTGADDATYAAAGAYNNGSVELANGESKTCRITNNDDSGTIIIVKVVTGGSGTFDYTGTGTGIGNFTLSPVPGTSDSKTYNDLSAGAYTVDEADEAGFTRTDLACVETGNVGGGLSTSDVASGLSTINLGNGETVTCTYVNSGSLTTRTQGFWSTHLSIMHAAWFGGSVGGNDFSGVTDKSLCEDGDAHAGGILDTDGKVLGGFWSSLVFTTTKGKRSDLDKARMQLAQQLLAAILNNAAFGSAPTTVTLTQARAAFCGNNIAAIQAAHSAMAAFNESGDTGLFTPGASANGKQAKDAANLIFWNLLPPQ